MNSIYSILPSNQKILENINIPLIIYSQPMVENIPILNKDETKQICQYCNSYFNGFCTYNNKTWNCCICGKLNKFIENEKINSITSINPSFYFTELNNEYSIVTHVIIIACGNILPIYSIMQSLPSNSPIHIIILTSNENAKKLITTAGNLKSLINLPKISIKSDIYSTLSIISTYLNTSRQPYWFRIFCSNNNNNNNNNNFEEFKKFNKLFFRIDYFIDFNINLNFINYLPGICRIFNNFNNINNLKEAINYAENDCLRKFSYQCKILIKTGNFFNSNFNEIIPIISSTFTSIPLEIIPPLIDSNLIFQCFQTISTYYLWDPPTNSLQYITNIFNRDFKINNDINLLKNSISPSILFDYIERNNLKLNINFQPLNDLILLKNNINFLNYSIQIFKLCSPLIWKFILNTFIETWKDKNNNNLNTIIIKKFPNIYYLIENDEEIFYGNSIISFIEICKPFNINIEKILFKEKDKFLLSININNFEF